MQFRLLVRNRLSETCFISSTGDIFFTMQVWEILQRQDAFWDKRSNLHFLHSRVKYSKGKNLSHRITVQQIVTWIFSTSIFNSVLLCKTRKGISRYELFDKFKPIVLKLNSLLFGQILYSSRSLSKTPLYFAGEAHLKLSERSWMTCLCLNLKLSSLKNQAILQSQMIGLSPSFLKNEIRTMLEQ